MLYITSLVLIYRTTGVCTSQPPLPIPPPLPLPLVTTKLISFSMIFFFLSIWKWSVKMLSHVWLFAAPWSVTLQASLSTGFSRQEYWSGLPFSSPRDLLDPGIEPTTLKSPALIGGFSNHLRSQSLVDSNFCRAAAIEEPVPLTTLWRRAATSTQI